ncbi:MAG TPA: MurT ligase domain-containing protein [Candidatus Sulfotelmatobacter sp.]|jgi:UDP-N-acetylmuramyl tripeptide synthase|nr:MurT ligase domain-containing protein [Candidatus Sulfotelmatobacter sp.]
MMLNLPLITVGKTISQISKRLNRGHGSTWPGHIALKGNKNFIRDILAKSKIKVIIVAGTNGKTTTSGLIRTGLEKNGSTVLQNESGANLLNGIASTILLNTNTHGDITQDYAIFEVDENALPLVLNQIAPDYLVLLNLFRDQLDRYGEINTIVQKWHDAINKLPKTTKLIINADDSQIAYISLTSQLDSLYFGLNVKKTKQSQYAADSVSCPKCGSELIFETTTFSHLGNWQCNSCGLHHPKIEMIHFAHYPLSGTYNKYNTHAAAVVLKNLKMTDEQIYDSFKQFAPMFGRQEIIQYQKRNVQLFLSKNPTSFNQSFQTIRELKALSLLIVLNDRIPDGRDISWIWDTNLPQLEEFKQITLAGDRVYDMALRLKYEMGIENYEKKVKIFENLKEAINTTIDHLPINETLYILPTYSAMLDIRKILTGRKIL